MIFLSINCWFGKCLKSDVCTDSFLFFCSHAALSLSLPTGAQPPLHLKFQLSVLANKLRIWSDSSTFYTLHLVFLRYCLYTSFMFFVFNWDTVLIILFCLTDDSDVRVFKFGFAYYRFAVDTI